MKRTTALPGMRYGRLEVLREAAPQFLSGYNYRRVTCRCDCGESLDVLAQSLTSGNSRSCGCLAAELTRARSTKPAIFKSGAHASWRAMKNRCEYTKNTEYPRYGGRGIRICERWQDFENFYADMGDRPAGYSLERVDIDADYSPSNCKWIPNREQARNRRTVRLTPEVRTRVKRLRNESMTYAEIAREIGVNRSTVRKFLAGVSFDGRDS